MRVPMNVKVGRLAAMVLLAVPLAACAGQPSQVDVESPGQGVAEGEPNGSDAPQGELPEAGDADQQPAPASEPDTRGEDPATGPEPAADAEPVYDCREVDGEEICDTFGESDEGPGTN